MDKCPVCGYEERINLTKVMSAMSEYVLKENGKSFSVMNSDSEELTIEKKDSEGKVLSTISLVRKDKWTAPPTKPTPTTTK